MKGIASAICPNCKYCEGMVEDSFYICGVTHSDGGLYHLMGVEDELYCTAYEEEINMSNLKVEGKVSDWCPNCKNCKGGTRKSNGVHVWLTEVECEDPYDGMVKNLTADSDICCSMFEMKSEKSCDKISLLQHELEMDKLRRKIHELEKEKSDHLKGIERLKKSQEKLQNQVKNLQATNEESYKREEKLEEKFKEANELAESWKRDYEFIRDKLVHPIYDILYPGNLSRDINVTDFLSKIKDLKIYSDENGRMYKEVQEWREKYIARGIDVDHLLSLNKKLDKKIGELEARVKYRGDIATGSAGQIIKFKDEVNKLNQTISDQDITIKALLITIKEMCKDE